MTNATAQQTFLNGANAEYIAHLYGNLPSHGLRLFGLDKRQPATEEL